MKTENYIKIYYPSKDKNGKPINEESLKALKDSILIEISTVLGGYTIFPVIGGYYNPVNKLLINENNELIHAIGNFPLARLETLGGLIKDILNQASVMVEHNGEVIFI